MTGYGLFGFLDSFVVAPPMFVQAHDSALVVNTTATVFQQQDNLLTSWLLSTISASDLSFFTDVQSAFDVWMVAGALFTAIRR